MEHDIISVRVIYPEDNDFKTSNDTKIDIQTAISKLMFSFCHESKIIDFTIIDEDMESSIE